MSKIPLAERLRPQLLSQLIGQAHLTEHNSVLSKALEKGKVPSMIFWGPPGTGKTTLAQIIAEQSGRPFFALSAINSGVSAIREVIEKDRKSTRLNSSHSTLSRMPSSA